MDSLSLKKTPVSRAIVTGALHVMPPSVERDARTALTLPGVSSSPLKPSVIWCTVPSGPNATHGSVPRSYPPPVQTETGNALRVHVIPPSNDAPATWPREPPFW